MITVCNVGVYNIARAIYSARNAMNSWDRSDSVEESYWDKEKEMYLLKYKIGKNDLELMQKLYKAGTEHRKYLRQIFISMDVVAPLYWWKEADQYRIGVTTNSCSTMHAIHKKEFELDDFSHEHLSNNSVKVLNHVIKCMNDYREEFIKDKDKHNWWQLIQLLPSSYNQRRTVTMNYENVMNIINQRAGHKLDEWNEFVSVLKGLPCVNEIMGDVKC